jgi:uncharacterized membrane protein YccC
VSVSPRPLTGRTNAQARAAARAALHVRFGRGGWTRPVITAICMAVPLTAGVAAGRPSYGMVASLGAFAGFYAHSEPYRYRARLLAGLVAALAVTAIAGSLASGSVAASIVVTGVVAAVGTLVCITLQTGPPREHFLVLVALMTSSLPLQPTAALARGGLVAAGGAVAWLVVMSGWLRARSAPERDAVAAALARIADLLDAGDGPSARGARHQATLAARAAAHAVAHAGGPAAAHLRAVRHELDELLDAALALDLVGEPTDPAWSPRIRAMASAVEDRSPRPPAAPPRDVVAEAAPERDGWAPDPVGGGRAPTHPLPPPRVRIPVALDALDAALRGELSEPPAPPERSLRAALHQHSLAVPTALRNGIAIAVAVALGHALHVGQTYWIALTVSAVLQGATLVTSLRRAIERSAGTLVGILIAAGIVALDPAAGVLVAIIVVLQLLIEAVIPASYAVAVALITPLTMLLSDLAAPGTISDAVLGGRAVDTVLGCAVGVAAGRLLWPRAARTRLPVAIERSLRAASGVLDAALRPDADADRVRHARATLQVELLNLRAVEEAALGDRLTDAPDADVRWPVVASVERLGTLVGAAPIEPDGVPAGLDAALADLATRAAGATTGAAATTHAIAVPPLPRMPRTQAELEHLTALLAEPEPARPR